MLQRQSRAASLWPSVLAVLAGSAALVYWPDSSEAAWDGTQDLRLGDLITAEFVAPPLTEVHKFSFYVMKDTVMNTAVTVDEDAEGLVPEVSLVRADDVEVPLGTTQVGNKIKNYTFTESGSFYLRVRATAGTGIYTLDTKSKYPEKVKGKTTTGSFQFDSGADILVSGKVKKSKGSSAKPLITGLTYNGGTVDLGNFAGTPEMK